MPAETNFRMSCSEAELRGCGGLRSLPRTSCSKEPFGGCILCIQCGRLTLRSSGSPGVCWNAECVRGSTCTRVPNLTASMMSLSGTRRLRADRASLWDLLPFDFMDAPDDRLSLVPTATNTANLPSTIGVLVFFRLLQSLEERRNTPGILKLIKQIPTMINNTPELYLSPLARAGEYPEEQPQAGLTHGASPGGDGASPGGVVDAIMSTAEGLLYGELSCQQQGDVLEAVVGLAIKRGSLAHCLRVIKFLLCSPAADTGLPIPGVGVHLKELERTKPSALGWAAAGETGQSFSWDNQSCEAGNIILLNKGVELTTENERPDTNYCDSSIPPSLREIEVIKVGSTACHNIALTVEGELLTWNCIERTAKQGDRAITTASRSSLLVMDRSRVAHAWRPAGDEDCICCKCPVGLNRSASCTEIGHTATPVVRQVFASKSNVTDVACGQGHTLALLETGQVFAWGNGRNGRLGLGDIRDRPSACHVEAIQGVKIEAVFCGVSHSMAVCSTGACYAWGKNNFGQCGEPDPSGSDVLSPRKIEGLKNFPVAAMAGGWGHTLALTRCGALFSFGGGYRCGRSSAEAMAVLGISASAVATDETLDKQGGVSPTRVCDDALDSTRVKYIKCGWDHCMVVTADGALFTWGSGRSGQLGHGDIEPRHTPTRVAFFTTRGGIRVRSAAGGRTFSAVTTVDGRVFEWGIRHAATGARGNGYNRDEEGDEDQGNDASEEDGVCAVEASVPRQVAGLGIENPRAIRLGEGQDFGNVLIELQSPAEPHPPPVGNLSRHSTTQLATSSGLDIPDDVSQPVGRVETAAMFLRHIERLATPHIPRDTTDIDRNVRQAVRVGKRIQKRMQHEESVTPMNPKHERNSSTTSSANLQQQLEGKAPDNARAESAQRAPICAAGKLRKGQEALNIVSRTPSPVAPFCIDTSLETFRLFLDLIKGIRERNDPVTAASSARNPSGQDKAEPSIALGKYRFVAEEIGPESCGEPKLSSLAKPEKSENQATKQWRATPATRADGFAVASRSVQLEMLRSALKLLKINLLHLVRVAATRRAIRENGLIGSSSAQLASNPVFNKKVRAESGVHKDSETKRTASAGKEGPTESLSADSDMVNLIGSRPRTGVVQNTGIDKKKSSSVLGGISFQPLGQNRCLRGIDSTGEKHVVIQDLHAELQAILEEEISDEEPEAIAAALAVQAEAIETFRVGFSVFRKDNPARVRLLRDVLAATSAGSPFPEHTEGSAGAKKRRRRSQPNSMLLLLAVEALSHENYAAGLVWSAFNYQGSNDDGPNNNGTGNRESGERFDAVELDAAMQSLLLHCAGDLHNRLWGGSVCDQERVCENHLGVAKSPVCPFCRLLLELQEHVLVCWGNNTDGQVTKKNAARELSLAHAARLLEQGRVIFTRLLTEGHQPVDGARGDQHHENRHYHSKVEALRNSFVSLIPALCTSVVVLPREGGVVPRAVGLLPLVVPLCRAVNRFGSSCVSKSPADSPVQGARSSPSWMNELEEALAMLSSDLVCSMIDMDGIKVPRHLGLPWEDGGEDVVEMLLVSSPFLAFDHESFDWSGTEDGDVSQPDDSDLARALEVIAFQEAATQEPCGCSRPPRVPTPSLRPVASNSTLPHPQQSLTRGHRRASHDTPTKLSPINGGVSPHGLPDHQSPSSAPPKSQGSARGGVRGESEGHGEKCGGAAGRQLDSIVDEARAEGFIQDLLCGRGAAQALYLWMTAPQESHFPVLHATSLATQGQGWGSYQSLSSSSGSDQQETESSHRRRRSRGLPSDVDAATRALVAVMIKSNGALTEAATFARCRLDRASSPPRALKLVAAAAAEVREALAGLADSLERDDESAREKDRNRRNEAGGKGESERNSSKETAVGLQSSAAAATLARIMRNCRFLLTCTATLPSIELTRKSCQTSTPNSCRKRSASPLPDDDRPHHHLADTLRRWAAGARNNGTVTPMLPRCLPYEASAKKLALIVQLMAEGRVEQALLRAHSGQKVHLSGRSASLESLVGFAANPIPLRAIKTRMRLHELRAKVRVSGLRLVHVIINETRASTARWQIGARLTRSLSTVGEGSDSPALFDGVGVGGNPATFRVQSAYLDLFRHVIFEVRQEHLALALPDLTKTRGATSLLVFLPLLQSLATMLAPSQLCQPARTILTNGNPGYSPPRAGPAATTITLEPGGNNNQGRPGRTKRAFSCPSVVGAEASGVRLSLGVNQESLVAVSSAVPVVGAVLGGQGDILTRHMQDPGCAREHENIHHAAWRALGVISMQLCTSAPTWATNTSGGGGPSQQAAGELERHGATRGWWAAVQATLQVVRDELTRTQDCSKKLRQRKLAGEQVMATAGAVPLLADPVSLALLSTWTFPKLPETDEREGCALSFWIWVPTQTIVQQPDLGPEKPRSNEQEMRSRRRTVYSRLQEVSARNSGDLGAPRRRFGVFLSQSVPHETTEGPGSTDDDDGMYVEMVLEKISRSQDLGERNDTQGGLVDERTGMPLTVSDSKSGDDLSEEHKTTGNDPGNKEHRVETETLTSGCFLPPGRWTHVCCSYSCKGNHNSATAPSDAKTSSFYNVTITFNGGVVAHRGCSSRGIGRTAETNALAADRAPTWTDGERDECNICAPEREGAPMVCDINWHPREVSPEQTLEMTDKGIPSQREDVQRAAQSYVSRLVALAEEMSASSLRVAATLSSPRWLSLWLEILSVAGNPAKRAIMRLLRPLLCIPSQPICEDSENARATSTGPLGSPRAPPSIGNELSDRQVVDHLCALLGGSTIPHLLSGRRYRVPEGGGNDSNRCISSLRQHSPMQAEVVLLLRSMIQEAPNRWQEHVFGALADGLATAANGGLRALSKSAESDKGPDADEGNQAWTWLGASAAAAYLGGGHIEGVRLGARVLLLPHPGYAPAGASKKAKEGRRGKLSAGKADGLLREMLGTICVSDTTILNEEAVKSACRGTVVGWTPSEREHEQTMLQEGAVLVAVDERYLDCLVESNPALQERPSQPVKSRGLTPEKSRVVAMPAERIIFEAEIAETATPFLIQVALPSVISLLDSLPSPTKYVSSSNDDEETGRELPNEIGAHQLVAAHLRCRLIRALAVQFRQIGQANAAVRSNVLRPLLDLATSSLASAAILALGSDGAATFGRQSDFAAVIVSLRFQRSASDSSLLSELESASQLVWERLTMGKGSGEGHQTWRRPRQAGHVQRGGVHSCGSYGSRPTLQVLGGEALIEGNRVTASSHFPTIRLSHFAVGVGSFEKRIYYEVTLLTGGLMQLGWAGSGFQCSPTRGQGVGDHVHSWAFDGFRQKRWCVSSAPYGKRWRAGDVVGVLLDARLQEMRFSMNGRDLGVAFVGFDMEGLYPAASMNVGQAALFNFGQSPFLYTPKNSVGPSFQPVSEASAENRTETDLENVDDGAQNQTHEPSPRGTRRRNIAATGARRSDTRTHSSNGTGHIPGGEEGENSPSDLERQRLVESLIGMGFPIEWAIRAAGRSGSIMSESAATAWIIERLEVENTKMEEEMGNMDTCEEDSAGGNSGIGDEYNDDTGESDDGQANSAGFEYPSEAAGAERRAEEGTARVDEGTADRRWQEMYTAVRRSFLGHGNGESPATAAARNSGTAMEAGWPVGISVAPSPAVSALLAVGEVAAVEGLQHQFSRHGLTQMAASAKEKDLPSLSLVLDTAMTILFARAAVVNLLTHIATPSATRGSGLRKCIEGGDGPEMVTALEVANGILEALAIPETQRHIVNLTKTLMTWSSPWRSVRTDKAFPAHTISMAAPVVTTTEHTTFSGRNASMEDSRHGTCFTCSSAADPIGIYPGYCSLAMRTLLDLVAASVKPWGEWEAWLARKFMSARWIKEGQSSTNSQESADEVARTARIPSIRRLLMRFVREAISIFETSSPGSKAESSGANDSVTEDQGDDRVAHVITCEPLALRSKCLWALWVLDTFASLGCEASVKRGNPPTYQDREGASTQPVVSVKASRETETEDEIGDGQCSILPELASARSSEAFAAVLGSAIGNDRDDMVQALAYSLCARMLSMARLPPPISANRLSIGGHEPKPTAHATAESKARDNGAVSTSPSEDGFELTSKEYLLARAFSVSLRSQVNTPTLSSRLLQSQLELLAQWEFRRSPVNREGVVQANGVPRPREGEWDQEELKGGFEQPSTPEVWINAGRASDKWDVATALFAGVEGGGDCFETSQKRDSWATANARRMGTADSEPSVLSSLPTPCLLGKLTPANHNSLLVEAVSATSVTVSWGGWYETGDEPELQVVVGSGDCLARPLTVGKMPGASDLAQALRSKLKRAASRRRDEGPGLVLKVRACGLWGAEPFRIAALDLNSRGCLKVCGLADDTRYSFQLERSVVSPSPVLPPAAADLSDDEQSCFPSAATVGANSTEGSSADAADGASALTGLDASAGGGGGSTCSEECTTVLTDESRRQGGHASYCTSSTRAVAGRNCSPPEADKYANMDFHWPSMRGRDRFCGASEDFVSERANAAVVATMSVATPPQVPFMLDAEGCGPSLRLTNSNLTVTNTGRKKWSAVRATRGIACGVHRWKVRIDRCVSKNVFVGVMSSEARLNNYVGSDRSGWGYLANKAIWHNKSKVRSYGDLFREGDTIGVSLNMDLGTLRFSRNGRDLGLAVQGLEGTLYPSFSMYNRGDQLTFVPPEDHAEPAPVLSPGVAVGEKNRARPPGGGSVLYGTFSAECVVRRASKVLEVLGALIDDDGLDSPAGIELVDTVRLRLVGWSRGEHGRSVPSASTCAPVRLDTSDQARRDLFGLGAGDRVMSAEGEAIVLGATRHSLWVAVEATSTSPPSACSPGFHRDPRAWGSEVPGMSQEGESRVDGGHSMSAAEVTETSSRLDEIQCALGRRRSKITSWSRSTVRQIVGRPEEYVVSRHTTPTGSADQPGVAMNDKGQIGAVNNGHLCAGEVRTMLARWTHAMDEALGHHLASLADSMGVSSPLDLPFSALGSLPQPKEMFPDVSYVTPAEVWARATLLLYVNDLALPLLSLIDTALDINGPLSVLVHKCRSLLFRQAKLSLLDDVIRQAPATAPSETASASATIRLIGVKSLPRFPLPGHSSPAGLRPPSWAQTSREVDKSVFGQVARHISRSDVTLLEEPIAFVVELVDPSASVSGEDAKGENVQVSDPHALYQGVFWQICKEVCSPPISMFVGPPKLAEKAGDAVAECHTAPDQDIGAEIPPKEKVDGLAPNPQFVSNGASPVCMDPGRVMLYRSLGHISGLAVRTGVPLPLSHLSAKWWMLVSHSPSVVGSWASQATSDEATTVDNRTQCVSPSVTLSSANPSVHEDKPLPPAICGVFASLRRLEEAGLAREKVDEILEDARFVAPLPDGQVTELLPGGLNRAVTSQNLGEYLDRLARLRASEFAQQAAAFRAGLEDALPKSVLSLLTWREMEELVCGASSATKRVDRPN